MALFKACTKCGQTKPVEQFPRRYDAPNATHRAHCYPCRNATAGIALKRAQDAWRERNRTRVNALAVSWSRKNSQRKAAAFKKWAQQNQFYLSEQTRRRYARKLNATPIWADKAAMRAVYKEARRLTIETGIPHEVDHIYPLKSDVMCGLHVPANLQVLTKSQNSAKKNRVVESSQWL